MGKKRIYVALCLIALAMLGICFFYLKKTGWGMTGDKAWNELLDLDKNITFDYAIGVSAGSANVASFLAGQRERNLRYYTDWIKDPGYFGIKSFIKTGNLFGLQHIYGDMTNSTGVDPIDFPALSANPTEYWIVATDAATGTPVYFPKSKMKQDDYRCIMASCALPASHPHLLF